MSLNRLCLRLATIAALTNNGVAPFPTAAADRVYDSRLDPIDRLGGQDGPYPMIAVYTDEAAGVLRAKTNASLSTAVLVIQFGIALQDTAGNSDDPIGFPASDSELETSLDVLESQICRAIAGYDPWQRISHGVEESATMRAQAENGAKLAIRYLVLTVKLLRDNVSGAVPEHVQPLLDQLSLNAAYAARAQLIRSIFEENAPADALLRMLRLHWSTADAQLLGQAEGEPVTVGNPLTVSISGDL